MTYYPTVRDVERIIKSREFGAGSAIINRGQLELALDKPKAAFYGREQYPELHQKAAALMEAICKAHALSDGNKRAAMAAAELMVAASGGYLVVPLKSVRLVAETAMDGDDRMSGRIREWFEAHVALGPAQLRSMLRELADEDRALADLQNPQTAVAVDGWLAFDMHPEFRRQWIEAAAEPEGDGWRPPSWAASARRPDGELWEGVAAFESASLHEWAMECLGTLREKEGGTDPILYHMMVNLACLGRHEQCAGIGEELLQRTPGDDGVLYALATALYGLERYGEAAGLLGRMTGERRRRHARERGMALHRAGRVEEAAECFDEGRGDPGSALAKASMLAELGRLEESARLYDELIRERPDDAELLYRKGLVLQEAGDADGGIECYRGALRIDPRHAECMVNVGAGLFNRGDRRGAMRYFEAALDIDPSSGIGLLDMGIALCGEGRYAEAIGYLERLRGLEPENTRCMYELACAYLGDGGRPEGARLLEELINHPAYAGIGDGGGGGPLLMPSDLRAASSEPDPANG